MAEKNDFKERVKEVIIEQAKLYKKIFIDYEYLICSDVFKKNNYYTLDAEKDNYKHLTGVNSNIKAREFFDKCYNGTIDLADFDYIIKGKSKNDSKGTIRRKILALPYMMKIFENNLKVEESFSRGSVKCSIATSDNNCTIGFIDFIKSRPMTLIRGNGLNNINSGDVSLVLRKENSKTKFDEIIIGDRDILVEYIDKFDNIRELIGDNLIGKLATVDN